MVRSRFGLLAGKFGLCWHAHITLQFSLIYRAMQVHGAPTSRNPSTCPVLKLSFIERLRSVSYSSSLYRLCFILSGSWTSAPL